MVFDPCGTSPTKVSVIGVVASFWMKKPLPGLKLTPAAPDQPVARLAYNAKVLLTGSKSQTFVVLFGAFGRMLSNVFAGFAPSEKFNGLPTATKALGQAGIVTLTYPTALNE